MNESTELFPLEKRLFFLVIFLHLPAHSRPHFRISETPAHDHDTYFSEFRRADALLEKMRREK
jgi:hypothetical protein